MPRSSPSTSPAKADTRIVEVVELDREAQDQLSPAPGNRPNRWAILLGIVVLAALGLSLLPASDPSPNNLDDTLPDPAVATTLVGSRQPRVAFISDDTFPMFVVSGLKGFLSLTEPVFFDDRWWIVGNGPDQAVVLSSDDGRLWEASSEIEGQGEASVRIDQLTTHDGALIAVGTEGTTVGPDFYSALAGTLSLWRSGDGVRWVPEMVDAGTGRVAFTDTRLATSGRSIVLQATVHATAPAVAALRLPAAVLPALAEGRLFLRPQATRLVVTAPLGIQVDETALSQVSVAPSTRLFRSSSFGAWEEIDLQFNVNGPVVAAPEGGFVVGTGGAAFTSAFGVNWAPNSRVYDASSYQDWGEGIMGLRWELGSQIIELKEQDGELVIRLPPEMGLCFVEGSNGLLAAACAEPPAPRPQAVGWNGFELSLDGPWLEMRAPDEVRRFRVFRAPGDYDPATDTIALTDSQGRSQSIPLSTLELLVAESPSARFDTMLSVDGLTWSRSQIALRAGEFELLGGIGDGYLVGTRSSQPGATYTVLAADF